MELQIKINRKLYFFSISEFSIDVFIGKPLLYDADESLDVGRICSFVSCFFCCRRLCCVFCVLFEDLINCFFCCLYVDELSSSFPFDIFVFRVVVVVVVCTSEFVVNESSLVLLLSFCGRFDTVQGNDVDWLFNCVWELSIVEVEDKEFINGFDGEDVDDGEFPSRFEYSSYDSVNEPFSRLIRSFSTSCCTSIGNAWLINCTYDSFIFLTSRCFLYFEEKKHQEFHF